MQQTAEKINSKQNIAHVQKHYTNWNGFNKNECDKGSIWNTEHYYKWVFETKRHGIWATKHAISTLKNGKTLEYRNKLIISYSPDDPTNYPPDDPTYDPRKDSIHDVSYDMRYGYVVGYSAPCYKLELRKVDDLYTLVFDLKEKLGGKSKDTEVDYFLWDYMFNSEIMMIGQNIYLHDVPEIKFLNADEYRKYKDQHPEMKLLAY
jgi:hypothetical protein